MLYYNLTVKSMFLGYRPQDKWIIPPDNSQLQVDSTIEQVNRLRAFTQNFHIHLQQFEQFIMYLRNPYQRNRNFSVVTEKVQFFIAISELQKGEHLIIETFNQKTLSYKGYISWFLIANENACYLIDSATLHDEIHYLQQILENPKIIKFALNTIELINNFKRDFGMIVLNVFNIEFVGKLYPKLKQVKEELNNDIQNQIQNNYKLLSQRPITKQLQQLVKRYFDMLIDHLTLLPNKPAQEKTSEDKYFYYLKWLYETYNLQQNVLFSYQHQPQPFPASYNLQNFSLKQQNLIILLVDLRQHMGRMRDLSPLLLIPNSILNQIVTNNANSVLEIAQIYEQKSLKIGMEVYNRIYNTIQLNEEKIKDLEGLHQDFLEKFPNTTPAREREVKDVKKLLRDIEWGESSEWLNRKNDPSIRLYKQIVSIQEFDESIYDEFVDSMKEQALKKSEIEKYLKYAQFMRGRNTGRLKEFYKSSQARQTKEKQIIKKIRKSYESDSQFSNPSDYSSDYMMQEAEEHEEQDNDESNKFSKKGPFKKLSLDDDDSDESPEKNTFNKRLFCDLDPEKQDDEDHDIKEKVEDKPKLPFKFKEKKSSVTSLDDRVEDKVEEKELSLPFKNKKPVSLTFPEKQSLSVSENSRKSSDDYESSLNCFEEEPERSSIKPLPETIQEIYNQAIESKKKISKKNTKKKDKKEHRVQKKQVDFVPRQNDMRYVLQQQNNNLK